MKISSLGSRIPHSSSIRFLRFWNVCSLVLLLQEDIITFLPYETEKVDSIWRPLDMTKVEQLKLQFYNHWHTCICSFCVIASENLKEVHNQGSDPFLKWAGNDSHGASMPSIIFWFCLFSSTLLVLPTKGRRWYMRYSNRYLKLSLF